MADIKIAPELLAPIRAITSRQGWTAEPVVIFSYPGVGLRLTAGPGRRGQARPTFLVVADSLPDAFRAVAACLDLIAKEDQP